MRAFRDFFIELILLIILCLITLKCDSNDPKPIDNVIKGTLTLPATAPGKEFIVMIDNNNYGGDGYVAITAGTCGSGTTEFYSFEDIQPGTYYIYAFVRVMSTPNNPPASGDFAGIYGGTLANPPSNPNAAIPNEGTVVFDISLSLYN